MTSQVLSFITISHSGPCKMISKMNKLTTIRVFAATAGTVQIRIMRPIEFGPEYFVRKTWFNRFLPVIRPAFLPRFIRWPKTRRDVLKWEVFNEFPATLIKGENELKLDCDFPDGANVAFDNYMKHGRDLN